MLFVNVKGREQHGIVDPSDVEQVKSELVERFQRLRTPEGEEVDVAVWKSQDAFAGTQWRKAPILCRSLKVTATT